MADDETHVRKSKTLFVQNLPYTTTNEKLETVFSEVGPIKRCFVVAEKGSEKCRGIGYVTYSLLDDAEKAIGTIKKLNGRMLRINFAGKKKDFTKRRKQKFDESKDEDNDEENTEKLEEEKTKQEERKTSVKKPKKKPDEVELKVLQIMGWPGAWSQAKVLKYLRKHEMKNFNKLSYPGKDKSDPKAVIRFKSGKDAKFAHRRLNELDVDGRKLLVTYLGDDGKVVPQKGLRQCRLIVRNLPFKCKEDNLREAFSKFGYVSESKIPQKPGTDGRVYGFGFVQFVDPESANKAVAEMNMKQILGRRVAVDWAIAKDKYLEARSQKQSEMSKADCVTPQQESKQSSAKTLSSSKTVIKKDLSQSDEGSGSDDSEGTDTEPRSDDSESQEMSSSDSENHESISDESEEEENEEESDEDDTSDEGFSEDDEDNSDDDSDLEDESDDDADDDDEEEDVKTNKKGNRASLLRKSDVGEGKTLFIRNVQYETHEDTLEEALSEFGKVSYCRVVINPDTGLPRGTAFVQFKTSDAADSCLKKACDDSKHGGIMVDGRKLLVSMAVSRDKAQEFKPQEKKSKEKTDKRNLHLAREGLIRPGTQAAVGLSKDDLTKRMKVEAVKRQKLKNPNIFVSTTRLCVRNIPISVSDKELKKVFLQSAQDRKAVITECRIMRDSDRVNSQGTAKSRGYGFVNFTDHKHALQALRTTNNNPDLFNEKRRLIVEFSLENKAAVLAKEKKMERLKARQESLQKNKEKGGMSKEQNRKTANKTKLTDKVIGNVKAPEGTVKQKNAKTLPSHWGPKVRHKPRPSQIDSEKKQKKSQARNPKTGPQGNVQQQKRRFEEDSGNPSKRKRRRKGDNVDDFDRLVNKYKNKFLSSNKSKWFDS